MYAPAPPFARLFYFAWTTIPFHVQTIHTCFAIFKWGAYCATPRLHQTIYSAARPSYVRKRQNMILCETGKQAADSCRVDGSGCVRPLHSTAPVLKGLCVRLQALFQVALLIIIK